MFHKDTNAIDQGMELIKFLNSDVTEGLMQSFRGTSNSKQEYGVA